MTTAMTFLPASFITNEQPTPCNCGTNRPLTAPDDDAPLRLPTVNWSESTDAIDQPPASCSTGDAIDRAFATNARGLDDDTLPLPPTLNSILAEEQQDAEREAENKPAAGQFILNAPEDDDAPLQLPYVVW